jgi:hypothetical protein
MAGKTRSSSGKRRKSFSERRRAAIGRSPRGVLDRVALIIIVSVIAIAITMLVAGVLDTPIEKLLGR